MKINYKFLGLVMFVILICCISAASATDVDNITVPDDTDVIEIDDAVDSVDDVEIEEESSSDNVVTQTRALVTPSNYGTYFNTTTGNMISNVDLTFNGAFNAKPFGNFIINQPITIDATGATFEDIGFDLFTSNITLIGGTFTATDSVATNATINVHGSDVTVTNTIIEVYAPEDQDFIAIDVFDSERAIINDNDLYYECAYPNLDNTNYVIRVKNSPNITITLNEITSVLPFKNVDYWGAREGMDMDLVAAIGINGSDGFRMECNVLEGYIENTCTGFPTLDMVIICDSDNGYVGWNSIDELDTVTEPDNPSYLYAIDLYRCNNLTIEFNEIYLESDGGTYIPGTINGTSAAYGIQLTGPYTGVLIRNNTIGTANNGPNAGIYSQNFAGFTNLTIINNTINVRGNASFHGWSLVTGMELQDDYVYIEGNTITVTNVGNYVPGHNAYGISFSQYYSRLPTSFVVVNNTIDLINGHYTVYIQGALDGSVIHNCLTSMDACGNATVYDNGNITIADNYCPQCNGINCNCTH